MDSSSLVYNNRSMEHLKTIEPNFELLVGMFFREKNRRTKKQIFCRWQKKIAPDEAKITVEQFIAWTGNHNETDLAIAVAQRKDVETIERGRTRTLVSLEGQLRRVTGMLMDEAENIMEEHRDEPLPLKERYFASNIVMNTWAKVTKEKEIAIKAHAEKRETVGMFAKLMEQAQSGEMTMEDVEKLTGQHEHIIEVEGSAVVERETA